ncbi:unnamed protein product [Prunus armeniaca]|uniref:Uncharacterized protein n=1 Tax=Prunus armeniaca TaxID=36596 RepID=A0A6J5VJ64_PRUAR|nr:unnamed protein product [Prunus armeniaca]CAB4319481.1 unnamed protein product [Prunus armeniaca]
MRELTHSELHTRQLAKKEANKRKASMKQEKTARKKGLASFIQEISPMQHGKGKQKKTQEGPQTENLAEGRRELLDIVECLLDTNKAEL